MRVYFPFNETVSQLKNSIPAVKLPIRNTKITRVLVKIINKACIKI